MDYHGRIVANPDICGSQPVIRGTRVLVRVILATSHMGSQSISS
jgi:uncharacterized protein (DUF433 family)